MPDHPAARSDVAPVLVEVHRGGFCESQHRGRWVVVGEKGVLAGGGDYEAPMLPRSALKPLQLLPFFAGGGPKKLGLGPHERAVLCASHSSDEGHISAVREILHRSGVPESALGCGAHAPIDVLASRRLFRRGDEPQRIHNNCSGKHSGFLARARQIGASLHDYLDPKHPVQLEVREVLHRMRGLELTAEGAVFDGCGAPMYAFPLVELAALFRDLAHPEALPRELQQPGDEVFHAFVDAPHFIAGYRDPQRLRLDTALMQAAKGQLFCKCGAEGVFAIGVRRAPGREALGIAVKSEDGAGRAYEFLVPQLLKALGLLSGDEAELAHYFAAPIYNTQAREVGKVHVRPFDLSSPEPAGAASSQPSGSSQEPA